MKLPLAAPVPGESGMSATSGWIVFVAAFGVVCYLALFEFWPRMATYVAAGKTIPTLDGAMFYSPSSVPGRLTALAPHHKAYRELEATIDMIFPLAYGLMFASGL